MTGLKVKKISGMIPGVLSGTALLACSDARELHTQREQERQPVGVHSAVLSLDGRRRVEEPITNATTFPKGVEAPTKRCVAAVMRLLLGRPERPGQAPMVAISAPLG
jgi:hypothetical protein